MAGETIKEVTVKIRLEVEKANDLRKAVESAGVQAIEKAQVDSVGRVQAVKRQAAAEQSKTVKQQIEELRAASEKETRMLVAADRLKDIRMQERLAAFKRAKAEEVRIEQQAEAAKRGTLGGNIAKGYGSASKFVRDTFVNILAATVIIENAESFLKELSDGIKKEVAGSPVDEGPVTEFTRGLSTAFEDLRKATIDLAGQLGPTAKSFAELAYESSGLGFIFKRLKEAGLIDAPVTRRIGGKDWLSESIESNRRLNSILLERTKSERAVIEAEKAKLDAAREEYGLLNADRREGFKDLAKRVSLEGIDSLTNKEREDLQKSNALRGLLSDKAKASADASGFGEIADLLGSTNKIADAQTKIDIEARNLIDINLDSSEDLAKVLEERLAPLLKQRDERIIQTLKMTIDKAARENADKQNQGF